MNNKIPYDTKIATSDYKQTKAFTQMPSILAQVIAEKIPVQQQPIVNANAEASVNNNEPQS